MVRRTQEPQEPNKVKPVLLVLLALAFAIALAIAILNPQTVQPAGAQEPAPTPRRRRRTWTTFTPCWIASTTTFTPRGTRPVLTTTFDLDGEGAYQIATIGTYSDGERVMITLLFIMVILQLYQFARKETKG